MKKNFLKIHSSWMNETKQEFQQKKLPACSIDLFSNGDNLDEDLYEKSKKARSYYFKRICIHPGRNEQWIHDSVAKKLNFIVSKIGKKREAGRKQ